LIRTILQATDLFIKKYEKSYESTKDAQKSFDQVAKDLKLEQIFKDLSSNKVINSFIELANNADSAESFLELLKSQSNIDIAKVLENADKVIEKEINELIETGIKNIITESKTILNNDIPSSDIASLIKEIESSQLNDYINKLEEKTAEVTSLVLEKHNRNNNEFIDFDTLEMDVKQEMVMEIRQDAFNSFEANNPDTPWANMYEASLLAEFLYSKDIF
jgi:hypothetical protein